MRKGGFETRPYSGSQRSEEAGLKAAATKARESGGKPAHSKGVRSR